MKKGKSAGGRRKKWLIVNVLLIVAAVASVAGFFIYRAYYHRDDSLKTMLLDDENYDQFEYGNTKTQLGEYEVLDQENLQISDVYVLKNGKYMQIRFRVTNSLPFVHSGFFREARIFLEDSQGNDLTKYISVGPERSMGRHGINLTFKFSEDGYMPRSREILTFGISAIGAGEENQEPYARGDFHFTVP